MSYINYPRFAGSELHEIALPRVIYLSYISYHFLHSCGLQEIAAIVMIA